MRLVLVAVTAAALAGLALAFFCSGCPAPFRFWLGAWSLTVLAGILFERRRYRPAGPDVGHERWQVTDERFIDPETGALVAVLYDPRTGERRYVDGSARSHPS